MVVCVLVDVWGNLELPRNFRAWRFLRPRYTVRAFGNRSHSSSEPKRPVSAGRCQPWSVSFRIGTERATVQDIPLRPAGRFVVGSQISGRTEGPDAYRVLRRDSTGREWRKHEAKERREILGLDRHLGASARAIPFDSHSGTSSRPRLDTRSPGWQFDRPSAGRVVLAMHVRVFSGGGLGGIAGRARIRCKSPAEPSWGIRGHSQGE
jgi:hypothetical protein